ncbi:hypothetical protein L5515_010499 [Caenorhabditis briggsae]|uniref:T-box domain-containing protein n=1 Tax=Caenorhabditis briggsae TaxID=6238 RepID=A0AAE9JE69_CAEBR|nr:hypothetical protein L5515_010499 [Caenorhabditis briggsae]
MHNTFQMHHPSNTVYDPTLRVHNTYPVYGYQQMMPVYQPIQRKEIQVRLKNQDQWSYLHKSGGGNEMMLKINGKPLFPKIQCDVQNLDASRDYDIGIKMALRNPKQFVHDKNTGWIPDENSDVVPDKESNEVFIRESGANLIRRGIDFGYVKIYNDKILKANEVPSEPKKLNKAISCKVNLRCLYIPVITIYEDDRKTVIRQFQFEETQFLAVSEYKNKVVRQFKIQNDKCVSSSPESLNRFSTSPPMTFDENQDPIVNYSNPMDTNCFGNEYNNVYPMQMNGLDFNAPPNPYPFDFNNDYIF